MPQTSPINWNTLSLVIISNFLVNSSAVNNANNNLTQENLNTKTSNNWAW